MENNPLEKYNIRPIKHLGQNFLIDESVLEKIISAAEISENDVILEIGPGLGILTFALAKKAKEVIAVEKDKKLAEILNQELRIKNIKNVEVINGDALKIFNFKIPSPWLVRLGRKIQNYKLVANIPYYLTSPLIRKFLEVENKPELMILMLQKEVGQRICAKPGDMSILSIMVQFYAIPEIIDYVSKKAFYPEPKVDSAIVKITPKIIPEIDTEKFFALVKSGFSAKRKFLLNNLKKKFNVRGSMFEDVFSTLKIDAKSRAEKLSIENWLKLYEALKNIL